MNLPSAEYHGRRMTLSGNSRRGKAEPIDRHDVQLSIASIAIRQEHDLGAVGAECWTGVLERTFGHPPQVGAVGVHDKQVHVRSAP